MYEKIKQFLYDFWLAIFAFVICAVFSWYCFCSRTTGSSTVNGTIHDINGTVATAGNKLIATEKQISNAEASIERADGAIRQSRERAAELQAGLDECEGLIDRSIQLNREIKRILEEAGKGDSAGTQEGENY